jgi:hypothetical protein
MMAEVRQRQKKPTEVCSLEDHDDRNEADGWEGSLKMWATMAMTMGSCNSSNIRREQLNNVTGMLQEEEAEPHPEWKDVADCSVVQKCCCALRKSLTDRPEQSKRPFHEAE